VIEQFDVEAFDVEILEACGQQVAYPKHGGVVADDLPVVLRGRPKGSVVCEMGPENQNAELTAALLDKCDPFRGDGAIIDTTTYSSRRLAAIT
jgi:hypothetical protein